ncbi:MAG: transcription elongation factor GreA [Alphaproteobacteria bacterium]
MDKVPFTPEGYATLKAELHQFKYFGRPEVIEDIATARAHGDLSENAEYHAAKEKQGFIESQIKDMDGKISRAEIIDPKDLSGDKVLFSATVTVVDEETDEESTYKIVGEDQSDIEGGFLSYTSPLARAMMGKTVGDSVEVQRPKGRRSYEIVSVEFK